MRHVLLCLALAAALSGCTAPVTDGSEVEKDGGGFSLSKLGSVTSADQVRDLQLYIECTWTFTHDPDPNGYVETMTGEVDCGDADVEDAEVDEDTHEDLTPRIPGTSRRGEAWMNVYHPVSVASDQVKMEWRAVDETIKVDSAHTIPTEDGPGSYELVLVAGGWKLGRSAYGDYYVVDDSHEYRFAYSISGGVT